VHLEDHTLKDKLLIKTRQALMDKVRVKINSKLRNSLYQAARIDLGLEECPEMLNLQLQISGQDREILPTGTRLFSQLAALGSGGTLLVLGEPGAGKTTLLMELAKDWLDCTDAGEIDQAIPIVLNLSSWGTYRLSKQKCLSFSDWVVEELHRHYQLRSEIGKDWLMKSRFVLLLDGLDEVAEKLQDGCVGAVNHFRQEFGTVEIVVCSRIADFQKLTQKLEHFQAAVFIQPLDKPQIEAYLQQVGEPLQGVKKALDQDSTLLELLKTPFFLWILSLAYPRRSADELLNLPTVERQRQLFNRYIDQMFQNRPMNNHKRQNIIRLLGILAQQMGAEKEFLIERIQPRDWLVKMRHQWQYRLITGIFFGLIIGLFTGMISGLMLGVICGLASGLFFVFELYVKLDSIDTIEEIDISRLTLLNVEILQLIKSHLIINGIGGIIVGIISGLIDWLFTRQIDNLMQGLFYGLFVMLFFALIRIFSFIIFTVLKTDIQIHTHPNQGIKNSMRNVAFFCTIAAFVTLILYAFFTYPLPIIIGQDKARAIMKTTLALPIFASFTYGGGAACIQHFSLRMILYFSNRTPWNFMEFFKQAEKRGFIQYSGGSYSFIHRYLQEYFASIAPLK
jgi:hypothetical protein